MADPRIDVLNRFRHQTGARCPGLVPVLLVAAALARPFSAQAQQQLPTLPVGPAPAKTLPTDALGQITPGWPPKKSTMQIVPEMVPGFKLPATLQAQPVACAAFKGSAADMAALRQTAREAAGRRAIAVGAFDPLIPKNCAGQEWAFYLRFLGSIGEGAL